MHLKIGEVSIAVEMANSGAYVICLARNKNALDSTINIIEKNGKQAVAYSCDISNNISLFRLSRAL